MKVFKGEGCDIQLTRKRETKSVDVMSTLTQRLSRSVLDENGEELKASTVNLPKAMEAFFRRKPLASYYRHGKELRVREFDQLALQEWDKPSTWRAMRIRLALHMEPTAYNRMPTSLVQIIDRCVHHVGGKKALHTCGCDKASCSKIRCIACGTMLCDLCEKHDYCNTCFDGLVLPLSERDELDQLLANMATTI